MDRLGFLKRKKSQAGFGLIDLAVALIVVGVLSTPVFALFNQYAAAKKLKHDAYIMERIPLVIEAFNSTNGRLPCPAPITANSNDPNYGFETDCSNTGASSEYGVFTSVQPVTADFNGDGVIDAPQNVRVRIGMVPFRSLNFKENYAYDSNNHRLIYAVTEFLASQPGIYQGNAGGITIQDASGNVFTNKSDYILLSRGADGYGAISRSGVVVAPCAGGTGQNVENCDADSIFVSDELSEGTSARQLDDLLRFNAPAASPKWVKDDYRNIKTMNSIAGAANDNYFNWLTANYANLAGGADWGRYVVRNLVSILPNFARAKFVNTGDVRVDGNIIGKNMCGPDSNSRDCFNPGMIAGNQAAGTGGTYCSGGVMDGISNGAARCRSDNVQYMCPGKEVVTSVNLTSISCGHIPCRGKNESLACGTGYTLPNDMHGASRDERDGENNCMRTTFQCGDGVWTKNTYSMWTGGGAGDGGCGCPTNTVWDEDIGSCPTNCGFEGGQADIFRHYTRSIDCGACYISGWNLEYTETANCPATDPCPPSDDGGGDDGPSDEGPSDEGPSDEGPSDDGPSDEGPSDEGPSDDGSDGPPGDDGPGGGDDGVGGP